MELNRVNLAKTDQILLSMDHHRRQDDLSPAKSYSCAFCKRGFSNAQALGGHMNIHRRDRAKLRESLEGTLSLGTPSKNADHNDHEQDEKSDIKSPRKPCSVSSAEAEACAQAKEDGTYTDKKKRQQSNSDSAEIELDLELRLGHEQHPHKK